MSVRVMEQVWRHCRARPQAKYVCLCIADHAHDDGTGAHPSVPRIAERTGLSRRFVGYALRELEDAGYLVVARGAGKVNRYHVLPTPAPRALVGPLHDTSRPLHHTSPTPAPHVVTPAQRASEPLEPPREPLERQVVVVYAELYGVPPTTAKWTYLASIEERWPADRAVLALRSEHAKDPDPRTICGRMVAGLKAGDLITRSGVA